MKGLTYALELVDKTFGPVIKKAKGATKGLDGAMKGVARRAKFADATSNKSFGNITRYAKRAAAAVGLVFAFSQAQAFAGEIETIGAKFQGYENAINFASGQEGGKNIAFLDKQIKDLNLDMTSSYKGFQTLTGSLKGTKLEGQGTRDIFEGVAIAATSMNLSADQSEGAFLALSQMASKGKVQAEELRGQLGERIPGALKIAADAMGVNQAEFNKMLDSGNVYAEDFLPKFAKALKENFSGGLDAAAKSMQSAKNKSNNAFTQMQRDIANSTKGSIIAFNEFKVSLFGSISNMMPKLMELGSAFMLVIKALTPIKDALSGLINKAGGATGIIDKLKIVLEYVAIAVGYLAEGIAVLLNWISPFIPQIALFTAGWWLLNIAMYANPVGLIVLGIIALIGAFSTAYQYVGWFRGRIMAAWHAIKGFGKAIKTAVIDRFKEMLAGIKGIAKAITLFKSGQFSKAFEAAQEAKDNLFSTKTIGNFADDMKNVGRESQMQYYQGVMEAAQNNKNSPISNAIIPSNANDKLLTSNTPTTPTITGSGSGGASGAVASAGGSSTKHTTFNIQSMVQTLTIKTAAVTGNNGDIKKQIERVFLELMGDLELRANG